MYEFEYLVSKTQTVGVLDAAAAAAAPPAAAAVRELPAP